MTDISETRGWIRPQTPDLTHITNSASLNAPNYIAQWKNAFLFFVPYQLLSRCLSRIVKIWQNYEDAASRSPTVRILKTRVTLCR
jgi:hypothetical protein